MRPVRKPTGPKTAPSPIVAMTPQMMMKTNAALFTGNLV
jgi:hypothetical protein